MNPRTILLILALLAAPVWAKANVAPGSAYMEVQNIAQDPAMSKPQKIAELKKRTAGEAWSSALYFLETIDHDEAIKTARAMFDNPPEFSPGNPLDNPPDAPPAATLLKRKLKIAKFLVARGPLNDPTFIETYAPFLLDAALHGGDEFMKARVNHEISAVGEYAFIASDFDGMSSALFPKIADKRMIGVLIRCLDAPDHINGARTGLDCVMHGNPGESTKRNTQRQQIPLALARLNAVEATPALRKIFADHHDWNFRNHAGIALGLMLPSAESAKLAATFEVNAKTAEEKWLLFGLGKGLIQRGEDAGVPLLAFRYSVYFQKESLGESTYMLEERLTTLANFNRTTTEPFYREALEYPLLRKLWLFDTYIPKESYERVRKDFATIADRATSLKLRALAPLFSAIAKESKDADIQRVAGDAAIRLTQK